MNKKQKSTLKRLVPWLLRQHAGVVSSHVYFSGAQRGRIVDADAIAEARALERFFRAFEIEHETTAEACRREVEELDNPAPPAAGADINARLTAIEDKLDATFRKLNGGDPRGGPR